MSWPGIHAATSLSWPAIGDCNCSQARLREFLEQHDGPHGDRIRGTVIVGSDVDLAIAVADHATAGTMGYDGSDHPVLVFAIVARGRLAAPRRWLARRISRAGLM